MPPARRLARRCASCSSRPRSAPSRQARTCWRAGDGGTRRQQAAPMARRAAPVQLPGVLPNGEQRGVRRGCRSFTRLESQPRQAGRPRGPPRTSGDAHPAPVLAQRQTAVPRQRRRDALYLKSRQAARLSSGQWSMMMSRSSRDVGEFDPCSLPLSLVEPCGDLTAAQLASGFVVF